MAMTCPHSTAQGESAMRTSGHSFVPKKHPASKLPHLPRLMERIFEPHSTELLSTLLNRSLTNIERVFFANRSTADVAAVRDVCSKHSHTTHVAVFCLLLNVDMDLKDFVLQAESPTRRDKMTRFFLDLKQSVVPAFFSDDTVSIGTFVQRCRECYLLA